MSAVPVKSLRVPLNRNVAPVAWESHVGTPISLVGTLPGDYTFEGLVSITAELHATLESSETPLAVNDDLEELPTGQEVTLTFSAAKMNQPAGRYYISVYAVYPEDRLEVFRVCELRLVDGAVSQLTPPAPLPNLYATTAAVDGAIEDLTESGMIDFDARLREIVTSGGYELTSVSRDSDSVITTGVVRWPDGTAGVFTTLVKNTEFNAVDSYSVTYAGSPTKTITQPTVSRNEDGAVTGAVPPLTIS